MQLEHIDRVFSAEARWGKQVELKLGSLNEPSTVYLHTPQCRELGLIPETIGLLDLAEIPVDHWPRLRFVLESAERLPWPDVESGTNTQKFPISLHVHSLSLRPNAYLTLLSSGTGGTVSVMFMPMVRLVVPATAELIAEVQALPLGGGFLLHRIEVVPNEEG